MLVRGLEVCVAQVQSELWPEKVVAVVASMAWGPSTCLLD